MKPAAALALPLLLVLGAPALAEEHVVQMLNRGEAGAMVFEPALVRAAVGDTVRFVPTDRGHNAETIEGMLPEGAAMVEGEMDEEVVLTVDADGVYGIRCRPHYAMGMVALIVAGEPANVDAAAGVSHPGRAGTAFEELLTRAAE
ncbi:pseudoazurin [Wenxinia marina]|uniref:Pseudoazurin n=1 Tax=Wenxinia marina DSM 24838 TaxID=1123501 RepID=A0A0D0NPQ4_9RHOB|nr:pseudoazurin [Wenxinia marina]KIQ70230.1 pseudoazurin [Wenxinia marina DSM 24838]GGL50221.1 pseudoazurin [Wenxinia marina]